MKQLFYWKKGDGRIKICAAILFLCFFAQFCEGTRVESASCQVAAKVSGDNVYVRRKPGRTAQKLLDQEKEVTLSKEEPVTIKGQSFADNEKWYEISFSIGKKKKTGYMLSDYIVLSLKTPVKGKMISASGFKVRKKPETLQYVKVRNKVAALPKGRTVTIKKEINVNQKKWFYVSFVWNRKTCQGYVTGNALAFTGEQQVKASKSPVPSQTAKASKSPVPSQTVKPSKTPSPVKETKPSKTPVPSNQPQTSSSVIGKTGVVTASALNVRTGAGTGYGNLMYQALKVQITKGTGVKILGCTEVNGSAWYHVSFSYKGENLNGFVSGNYILVGTTPVTTPGTKPVASRQPAVNPSAPAEKTPSLATETQPLSEKEFEKALEKEGFPESYKGDLRTLHQKYPLWQFKVYRTGQKWDTAIEKENIVGKNLITKSKASGWKSYEAKAYKWETDSFVPFDGSTWVTASKAAIEYYMDPRNFLTTDGIFQFEYLGYEPEYQKESGVESILKNTVLSHAVYGFTDGEGTKQNITYGKTFIEAANYSKVNPFHLATRVKQEVVTAKGLSSSATGLLKGYQGYYNFYNIGATHSTAPNGAVINGLKYAKTGGSLSEANKAAFLIPWNSPYNAIVGGAKYIGNNYIVRGQNTVYLQKFNLSSYNTFGHQYMANVEAAKSEAQKTYAAYQYFQDIPVVFYIPVYENMPAKKAPVPENVKNPNNWLETLTVSGSKALAMTPTFKVSNSENTSYTVMVDSATTSVTINATSVSSLASIAGTGVKTLELGTNTFKIKVTAQNGNVRTYSIYIIRA
ncbi:cadherin-like beta sandwich domain-containing protein [[Clostridium] polysaccharolyticum]|uniref:Beta-N-acetylglucosaminidase n=1 Tax=[Clostridium] polysaccharolyticum TaxID=29364 RepID=A0A1H9YX37_9FIRM|nr:cadherin-like beta sandwich domain-containing protein [[Clostridium] polysaccharolyticum]SES73721.1 Beta-N-acetylglucosaminidase [[Clostridium] polysaccharolyticum]